jgi:hypothetical protein
MKRIKSVGIFLVVAVVALVCFAVPKYKFSKEYDVPHGLTPEQTIEKYFEYINDNSPKQANLISLTPNFSAFSFSTITSASADRIDDYGMPLDWNKYGDYYEAKQYLVNYQCHYLPFVKETVFWGPSGSIFFALVRETEDSDWKIAETYTGP